MSLDCYCDYEPWQVYRSKTVKARKQYRCYECNAAIDPGEEHEYAFGVYDGYACQPRTCKACLAIRHFVKTNIPCWCWGHGNLIDDAKEIVRAAYEEAPDEVKGVAFGLGRLIVKARKARRNLNHGALQ